MEVEVVVKVEVAVVRGYREVGVVKVDLYE